MGRNELFVFLTAEMFDLFLLLWIFHATTKVRLLHNRKFKNSAELSCFPASTDGTSSLKGKNC